MTFRCVDKENFETVSVIIVRDKSTSNHCLFHKQLRHQILDKNLTYAVTKLFHNHSITQINIYSSKLTFFKFYENCLGSSGYTVKPMEPRVQRVKIKEVVLLNSINYYC